MGVKLKGYMMDIYAAKCHIRAAVKLEKERELPAP